MCVGLKRQMSPQEYYCCSREAAILLSFLGKTKTAAAANNPKALTVYFHTLRAQETGEGEAPSAHEMQMNAKAETIAK